MHAKDRTVYDFNQYGQRPEIFPVKIYTNADYSMEACKVKDELRQGVKKENFYKFSQL